MPHGHWIKRLIDPNCMFYKFDIFVSPTWAILWFWSIYEHDRRTKIRVYTQSKASYRTTWYMTPTSYERLGWFWAEPFLFHMLIRSKFHFLIPLLGLKFGLCRLLLHKKFTVLKFGLRRQNTCSWIFTHRPHRPQGTLATIFTCYCDFKTVMKFRLRTNVFFKKDANSRFGLRRRDCVLTHVLSPPSRYSLMQFQVLGILFACKSASKVDARKHISFGLACGVLVWASAPTSPPSSPQGTLITILESCLWVRFLIKSGPCHSAVAARARAHCMLRVVFLCSFF
jgi:hypothetical protein